MDLVSRDGSRRKGYGSLWWALDELDTLADVALEASVTSLEQLLLVCVGAWDDVDGLLDTVWAELDWNGEELAASLLLDLGSALDTWKVDKGRLDDARLALGSLDELLGEAG